jgi:hypothetical protein
MTVNEKYKSTVIKPTHNHNKIVIGIPCDAYHTYTLEMDCLGVIRLSRDPYNPIIINKSEVVTAVGYITGLVGLVGTLAYFLKPTI